MSSVEQTRVTARVLAAGEGEFSPPRAGQDRFMIDGQETGGQLALVQQFFEPHALAAPMHRHTREDEFTYVLEGHVGAWLGGREFVAGPGDLIFKPRNQWHTYWNAGDTRAVVLEMISSAGLEELFREIARQPDYPGPEWMEEAAKRYGCQLDFEATQSVAERHGLEF